MYNNKPLVVPLYVKNEKTKIYKLDENGEKIPQVDKEGKPKVVIREHNNIVNRLKGDELLKPEALILLDHSPEKLNQNKKNNKKQE